MFALAIYDQLTPGSLAGGAVIAGTGSIDTTGRVSAIGGVQEKIAAASRDGATAFLLPTANCSDVGEVPSGLRLIPVENLGDALSGLQDLQDPARAEALAGCS
jgi:PDZ domain-containing protein